jgi:hypothetical protein
MAADTRILFNLYLFCKRSTLIKPTYLHVERFALSLLLFQSTRFQKVALFQSGRIWFQTAKYSL